MSPGIATLVYTLGICGLFALDRDRKARTSIALWIPVLWLLINGSRPVSVWLQSGPTIDSPDKYLDGSPLDAAVFGSLLAVGLIALVGRGRQVITLLRANVPFLVFFGYCALSILWSDYPFVAFKRWIKAAGDVVMVLIVLTDRDRLSAVRQLLARLGFLLVPLSILFIKYYPDLGRSYNAWTWIPMYCGVALGKNLLGMTCLVAGLGAIWRLAATYRSHRSNTRTRQLVAHGALLAMVIWLLRMANSMTSISCLIVAGGLIVLTSVPRVARKPAVVHFMVAAVVGFSMFALFLPGTGLVKSLGRDPTLTGRTAIWRVVISLVRNPLFGTGFESFWLGERLQKVWDLTEQGIQEAHNGYLEVYLNLGWMGAVLLAVIIVTGYRNVVASLRRGTDEACGLWLGFLMVGVIYNFTEAGFRMMSLVWIAFVLAIMAVSKNAERAAVNDRSRSKPAQVMVAAAVSEVSVPEFRRHDTPADNRTDQALGYNKVLMKETTG
jgi:exopolysaccharide production protein ExoQ